MASLLEVAKNHKSIRRVRRGASEEEVELAVAWTRGEISTGQLAKAIALSSSASSSGGAVLYFVATVIREGVLGGLIKIN